MKRHEQHLILQLFMPTVFVDKDTGVAEPLFLLRVSQCFIN